MLATIFGTSSVGVSYPIAVGVTVCFDNKFLLFSAFTYSNLGAIFGTRCLFFYAPATKSVFVSARY